MAKVGLQRFVLLAVAGLYALAYAATAAAPPGDAMDHFIVHDKPKPVPAVSFTDGDGNPLTLADFAGQVVLLNLWATWCGPCRVEMPELDELQGELGGERFQVVALSGDRAGAAAVEGFFDEIGVRHLAVYVDKTMAAHRALQTRGLPTTLLLDARGREVGRMAGAANWASPAAKAMIRRYIEQGDGPADDDTTTTLRR